MKVFYNLKVGTKLLGGFGACIAATIALGVVALGGIARVHSQARNVVATNLTNSNLIGALDHSLMEMRVLEARLLFTDGKAQEHTARLLTKEREHAEALLAQYGASGLDGQERANFNNLKQSLKAFEDSVDQFFLIDGKDATAAATYLNTDGAKIAGELRETAVKIAELNNAKAEATVRRTASAASEIRTFVIAVLFLSVAVGTLAALTLARQIAGSLRVVCLRMEELRTNEIASMNAAVLALEHGDLTASVATVTTRLKARSNDELGQLAAAFNGLLDLVGGMAESFRNSQASLRHLVTDLQSNATSIALSSHALAGTAEQLGGATAEIGSSMQEVASATEQAARGAAEVAQGSAMQARSVSESSAMVKQLASAVRKVATDAEGAAFAVEAANSAAVSGVEIVSQSIAGMKGIQQTVTQSATVITTLGESSQRIGSIVQTINEIAEQTNLLALNAAIEAARAGEAGRGFAVVADEVRKLAERSGSATREIGELIAEIQSQTSQAVASMKEGTDEARSQTAQAERAGQAFRQIQDGFAEVIERVEAISAAAKEMSVASDSVSKAMSDVAAVVEESSAAAEQLSASAEEVSASVQTVAGATDEQSGAVHELIGASQSLQLIAGRLQEAVSIFRTDGSDCAHVGCDPETLRLAA